MLCHLQEGEADIQREARAVRVRDAMRGGGNLEREEGNSLD